MFEQMKINTQFMGNGNRAAKPQVPARQISSFSEFKKKVSLIPMDEEIRKAIFDRVNKYPEASLDYVWVRLQDFVAAAIRERANKSRQAHPIQPKVEVPVPEVKVPKPVVEKPNFVRPNFDLEEFGETNEIS